MKLSILLGLLAYAFTTQCHSANVTVPASAVHLCVNVHDQDGVRAISAMRETGFTCFRKDATGAPMEAALAAAGAKGDYIITDGPQPSGQLAKVSALAKAYPGSVEFLESRNEVNNRATMFRGLTDTVGADQSRRQAIQLYDAALEASVRADPNLVGVQVLAHTDIHASPSSNDWANAHAYDGETDSYPDYWPWKAAQEMGSAMPGKPQALTEFGVKHAERQARLLPQWVAASLANGIDRLWLYELRDAPGDPYGLYNADWTPKPAIVVIRRLNAVLADRGVSPVRPLAVTVSDTAINSVLIGKSDGSYVHLLWRSWPDGKVHPFTWSYDRNATVRAVMYPHSAATWVWDSFLWIKAAGQPSGWSSYTDGVLVLVVKPTS